MAERLPELGLELPRQVEKHPVDLRRAVEGLRVGRPRPRHRHRVSAPEGFERRRQALTKGGPRLRVEHQLRRLKPLEVLGQLLGRRVTLLRVARHRLLHDAEQLPGHAHLPLLERWRRALDHPFDHFVG